MDGVLDARLLHDDPAPLAVAFSGGGDSLALLLTAKAWADRRGRVVVAITIDHRLRAEGADWALWCAARARALGVDHRTLAWDEAKPATGLAAAARRARHERLARAARDSGARVVLMGHTLDDVFEAAAMRADGARTPSPRCWTPSPVWPEGRGVFLLRPLLRCRRAGLRAALRGLGETWIDDPANLDMASPRARARAALETQGVSSPLPPPAMAEEAASRDDPDPVLEGPAGELDLPVAWLRGRADAEAVLARALVCAAGGARAPRTASVSRLLARALAEDGWAATLAGARMEVREGRVVIARDAGDRRGAAIEDMALPVGQWVVWDGRVEIRARAPGSRVGLTAGQSRSLPRPLRQALGSASPGARRATPLVTAPGADPACPTVLPTPVAEARSLTRARFQAALGAIVNEAMLRRMAERGRPS